MSLEQLKVFLAKAKGDSNLQEKLKAANSAQEVADIAKEHGHEFTADKISLLNEQELEHIAGGVAGCIKCYDSNNLVVSKGQLMP
ncbi:Nif11-like leader peptide family natural product precursor [Synechococcus sp. UW179A]|uniref:Nif11-like leader peptide family natural product precursor n=1 Tax=Synechococcus sp. UW179A TaxID=2575510 RepID=UPI000E0E9157|nr:Nif11-like leader peptide family natural product precursor [Synechococcus sp. UW179A]